MSTIIITSLPNSGFSIQRDNESVFNYLRLAKWWSTPLTGNVHLREDIIGGDTYTFNVLSDTVIADGTTLTGTFAQKVQYLANNYLNEAVSGGGSGSSGAGTSGFSGKSGFSGRSGYSGYSGAGGAGSSGFSGYSGGGSSGFSGYSGQSASSSGYSGFSGLSGYSGYSGTGGAGASGFSGFSGAGGGQSGFSGYSGIIGGSGYSGFSGSGLSGYSGYSGAGTSGFSGYSGGGTSGFSGYSGFSGKSGYSGYSGSSASQIIDVAAKYGVVADGSTDNATALMQMRSDLAGLGKPFYTLIFPVGEIRYSNNRWLYNIQRFRLEGNGSTFRTIYAGSDNATGRTVFNGNMFQNNVLAYVGTQTWTTSYPFATASAGAVSITSIPAANDANCIAGNRALLYGFDNTGAAYPPGCRSSWVVILSRDTGTGVITFTMPLDQSWNSAWWDDVFGVFGNGTAVGRPRISFLDRSDFNYCRYAEFNNMTFGRATGGLASSGTLIFPSEHTIARNCFAEDFIWPSETINMEIIDCEVSGLVENDKLVKSVLYKNMKFRSQVTGGSNVANVVVDGSYCAQAFLAGASEELVIRNTYLRSDTLPDTFRAPLSAQDSHNPMRRLTIDRNTFAVGASSVAISGIDIAPFDTLTISVVTGNNIVIPFTGFGSDSNFATVRRIKEGITKMFKDDGSNGGLVTAMTQDYTYNPTTKTGVITTATNSTAIVGVGTSFTTQFAANNYVTSGGVFLGIVQSVTDNTHMTLNENALSAVTAATYALAQGAFVIAGNWSAPTVSDVWVWSYLNQVIDLGSHQNYTNLFLFDVSTQRWAGNLKTNPPYEMHLNQDSFQYVGTRERVIPIYAKIISIEVDVKKIFTGSDATAKVQIYRPYGSFDLLATINLKTAGRRYIDEFISYPASPISGDDYGGALLGWCKTLGIYGTGSGSGNIYNNWTNNTKAYFDIIVTWEPF